MSSSGRRLPGRLVVVAGTYDGVLAGWDSEVRAAAEGEDGGGGGGGGGGASASDGTYLKMSFAMAVHEGSVRCLSVSSAPPPEVPRGGSRSGHGDGNRKRKKGEAGAAGRVPGTLLSGGYDESISVFNLVRNQQAGELRSPSDLGTPTCSSFAPPPSSPSPPTHALVGMSSGKIVLYKKRDWSVQHVLSGHDGEHGGVNCLAVHPSGRMAMSGGRADGKIVLWDLMKGRLAFVHRLPPPPGSRGRRRATVTDLTWSGDGRRYAFSTDWGKVTARDVDTGEDLLDVVLPSRANSISFIGGDEGLFLAAACEDGSLPVLAVGSLTDEEEAGARRAVMAIEPVDGPVAGDARYKCLQGVEGGSGFLVVTANSGGTVSLIDLEGAVRLLLTEEDDGDGPLERGSDGEDSAGSSDDDDEGEGEAAAEFLDSVRIGTGARITNIAVWSSAADHDEPEDASDSDENDEGLDAVDDDAVERKDEIRTKSTKDTDQKMGNHDVEMDADAVAKARALVKQAKKRQKRQKKKKQMKD